MICLTFYIDDCLWGVFVIAAPLGIAFRPTVARRVVVLEFCDDHESRQGSSAPDSLWLDFVVTVPQPSYRGVSPRGQITPNCYWGVLIHGYKCIVYPGPFVREILKKQKFMLWIWIKNIWNNKNPKNSHKMTWYNHYILSNSTYSTHWVKLRWTPPRSEESSSGPRSDTPCCWDPVPLSGSVWTWR